MAGKEIDSRIVEMQFDGKDFDKNIRKSQKNLEDFKESLNFEDALSQMGSSLHASLDQIADLLKKMQKDTENLSRNLTGIGKLSSYIAGKVKKAWQDAFNSVERFTKSMTTDQVKEGSQKYDGLLKAVQTIKNATGETEEFVYQKMGDLLDYTDETSYNFADMASNVGKFTTAGVGLGNAVEEMKGIANWAALAGQGTGEAQRAMYNISQAMSAGEMRLQDWRSIQNANMDIRAFRQEALEAAVAAGTLKKSADGIYKTVKGGKQVTLDNFTETLQYKWFDKKTMEAVFKTFSDNTQGIGLEAYKAAQRCTTLSDAVKAWQDMLSTGWMKSYEAVFGRLSDAMGLFSGLCNKVSEDLSKFVSLRNGILERWSLEGRNSLWGALVGELESPDGDILFKGAYGLLDAMRDIGQSIYEAFWDFVGNFVSPENKYLLESDPEKGMAYLASGLTNLTKKFQEFTKKLKDFLFNTDPGETESRYDRIKHVVEAIFAVIMLIVNVIRGVVGFAKDLITQLYPAIHVVELLIDMLLQMFTGSVVEGAKNNSIGNFFHRLAETLRPVTSVINVVVKALAGFIAQVAVMLKQSGLLSTLGSAIHWVLDTIGKGIQKLIDSGMLQSAFNWIQKMIAKIPALVQRIKTLWPVITGFLKNNKVTKGLSGFFTKLFGGKGISGFLKSVKTGLSSLIKKIPEVFASMKGGFSGLFEKIVGFILGLFGGNASAEGAAGAASGSSSVASKIADIIVAPIKELGSGNAIKIAMDKAKPGFLQNLKTKVSEIWNSIVGFFSSIANSEAVQKIKGFFAGTTFKELLSGATGLMKWLAVFRTGSGLVSMGKGLKSLGKGIKFFSKNMKNLNLSNIFSNMFNISNIINSNNTDSSKRSSFDFGKLGNQLLQIALAIGIVVLAASHLAKMDTAELEKAGICLGIIIATLIGSGWIAKKVAGKASGLISLALAVLVLIVPLKILQKMAWADLADGLLKLAAVMAVLALAARLAGSVKMKGFVGMAVALNLLLIPLKVLSKMPLVDDKGKITGVTQAMGAIIMLMLAMGVAAGVTQGNKMKGMLSFAIALDLLLIPIKVISGMELGTAAKGVGAILLLIIAITAMVRITKGIDAGKLGTIVAALTALSFVGWLIGHTMNIEQAAVGFLPILLMIAAMSVMFKQISKLDVEQLKAAKAIFTSFAAVIIVIAAAIITMSVLNVDWKTPAAFMAGLILLIGSIGVMLKLAAKTDTKAITRVSALMGVLVVLILATGAALIFMSQYNVNWEVIAAFTGGLSVLIGALAVAIPILGKLSPKAAITGILVLAAAVVAIMGAVSLMLPVLLGSVGEGMQKLASKMRLMATSFKGFFTDTLGISDEQIEHAKVVFDGIKELILKFAGFGNYEKEIRSVMSQLNYLGSGLTAFFMNDSKYPNPDEAQSFKALEKFIEIGPSLAAFNVGNLPTELMYTGVGLMLFQEATKDITTDESPALSLLEKIVNAATSATGKIDTSIAVEIMRFGEGIGLFNWATASIKSADSPALQLLQGIFGQADNIEKFVKLPLSSFRSQMTGLGGAMSLYAKGAKEVTGLGGVDGIDDIDISNSVEILKKVCAAISGESGEGEFKIPENMPSEEATGLFAGQLEALGTALSTFADAASKMETNSTKAIELLKLLGEIGGYLTPENLTTTKAFDDAGVHAGEGEGTLGQFALDIAALSDALDKFGTLTGNKNFDNGMGALSHLAEINGVLTSDSLAFAGVFTGASLNNTLLSQFALDIGALGVALGSFGELTGNTLFDNGLGALDHLADINSKLTKDSLEFAGVFDEETKTALGTFSDDVLSLGGALGALATNITKDDGTPYDFSNAITSLDALTDMEIKLSHIKLDGVLQWFTGNSATLGSLATEVSSLGDALGNFNDAITGTNGEHSEFNAEMALATMDVLGKMIAIINGLNVDQSYEITDKAWELLTFFNTLLYEGQAGINPYIDKSLLKSFAQFAADLSEVFNSTEGIDSAAVAMFSSLANAISAIVTLDTSQIFTYPGEMIAAGIASGIRKGESEVVNAIVEVVQAAIDAGNEKAVIKSPSRVFMEMGEYMDAGLIEGLGNRKDEVGKAGADAVQSAISGAGGIMAAISQAMAESTDLEPTISPVLDLSNITGAGSTLDRIFGGYSLSLNAILEKAIAATTNSGPSEVVVQNPTDLTGIMQSISSLQENIVGLHNAISSIKIVLNTGTVAGGITDDIDHNLGRKSLYASRRN